MAILGSEILIYVFDIRARRQRIRSDKEVDQRIRIWSNEEVDQRIRIRLEEVVGQRIRIRIRLNLGGHEQSVMVYPLPNKIVLAAETGYDHD